MLYVILITSEVAVSIDRDKLEVCDYAVYHSKTTNEDNTTRAFIEVCILEYDLYLFNSEHDTWQDTEQELKRLMSMYKEQGVDEIILYGLNYRLSGSESDGVIYGDILKDE